MKQLDSTDYRILEILQQDAKTTIKEIAAVLSLTTTPVYERIRRLEEEGYIRAYIAVADKKKLDFQILAFCSVSLKEHQRPVLDYFEAEVKNMKEVAECYHIAGAYDYILKVVVRNMSDYQDFMVNKLATMDHVGNVQSVFAMTEVKCSGALPFF